MALILTLVHAQAADSLAVVAVEHAANEAVVRGDSVALDTLWAASLRFRHSDGRVDTRIDWQRRMRDGPSFEVRASDSLSVDLHGDVAIVTGRLHVRTREPDEYWVRYLRVYTRRNGRWVLHHHRSLSLSEDPPLPGADPRAQGAVDSTLAFYLSYRKGGVEGIIAAPGTRSETGRSNETSSTLSEEEIARDDRQ